MTDDITQIKERQDRLEGRVTVLENTVNVEAIARAGMEDDLEGAKSDIVGLKATKQMLQTVITASSEHREQLQALAATTTRTEVLVGRLQADFKDRFDAVDAQFVRTGERFDAVDARLAKVDARFDAVDARLAEVDARFDKVDARFAEVDARFDKVDARFAKVDERFDRVEAGINAILDRLGPPPGGGIDQN
jgi:chromosome segregation ATPase